MKNFCAKMTKQCRRTVTPKSCGKLYLLKAHDIPKFDWSIRSDLPIILSLVLRMTLDFDLVLGARGQLGKSFTNGLGTELYFFVFLVSTARGFTLQVH